MESDEEEVYGDDEDGEDEEASATSGLRRLLAGQGGRGQAISI